MIRVDSTGKSDSLIQVRGLDKTYRRGGEEIQVLQRLNLDVDNLIPLVNVFQNVDLPLLLTKLSKSDRRKNVETALGVVGLAERMNHYPRQLSGGQEQRVAIARAIVADPTFLLCDEPTGDLDRKSADEIMALLAELVGKYNKTILMVTHDPVVAARAHTTLHLEKGVLVEGKTSRESVMAGGAV
jgi:putative ABC transport system ATP-binding protein